MAEHGLAVSAVPVQHSQVIPHLIADGLHSNVEAFAFLIRAANASEMWSRDACRS